MFFVKGVHFCIYDDHHIVLVHISDRSVNSWAHCRHSTITLRRLPYITPAVKRLSKAGGESDEARYPLFMTLGESRVTRTHLYSRLSLLERRLRGCVVPNIPGSSPVRTLEFLSVHFTSCYCISSLA